MEFDSRPCHPAAPDALRLASLPYPPTPAVAQGFRCLPIFLAAVFGASCLHTLTTVCAVLSPWEGLYSAFSSLYPSPAQTFALSDSYFDVY